MCTGVCVYRLGGACVYWCVYALVWGHMYMYTAVGLCVCAGVYVHVYSCGSSVHMVVYACTGMCEQMCADRCLCMHIRVQAHDVCDHKTIAGVDASVLSVQSRVSLSELLLCWSVT